MWIRLWILWINGLLAFPEMWKLWISLWKSGEQLWKGCAKVIIEHQGQALTVAMEMERRAIRTYERALLLAKDEEVRKGIEDILGDERRHLKRFTEMWDKTVNSAEQQVLLQAMAADVLFRGGVTEMARENALTTLTGLYRYAMESEANAVETYTKFAEKCEGEARAAFLEIVREEAGHLAELKEKLGEG